jgi:hypothetical protein
VNNFDFHGYCGGDKYPALKVLLNEISKTVVQHGWLTENITNRTVETI